ncbi:MAG: MATE family efflux transporter [Ruminococcus sp.]|nr:MATE family efflux transporter [Ruminococcus sp.]
MFSNNDLKKLIIPLVIEQTLVMLVGMADTLMVSYAGEEAISGVALVDMFEYMIITILTSVSAGGAIIVSQYLGCKDEKNADLSASQLMTVSILISAAISAVCLIFHTPILNLLYGEAEADVISAADSYLTITAGSFFFMGIYNSASAIYRSMGKTKITMYVSLMMNIINISGNAIGIFVLKAGVVGVAVPTLVSRAVSGIVMTLLAFNRKNQVYISTAEIFLWNKNSIRKILKIAVPNGIENGLFSLGKVLVTGIISGFGTSQIAANGVTNSIQQFAVLVVVAVNPAIITVVGQCIGAGEKGQAEYYTKKLMKISYISILIIGTVICLLMPIILSFYELSDEARHYCYILITMHNVMAVFLHPTAFNLNNSLRAAGDVKFTMYAGIGSMIVCRLGFAYLLGYVCGLGVIGVWIAMIMDWLARSVLFVLRYRSGRWKEIRVI